MFFCYRGLKGRVCRGEEKTTGHIADGEMRKGKGGEIRIILFRNFYKEKENMGSPVFSFLGSS